MTEEQYCDNGHLRTYPDPECQKCRLHRVTMNPDYVLPTFPTTGSGDIYFSQWDEPGEQQYLVQSLIPEDSITILYGGAGQGTSIIAAAMALCVAAGVPFLDLNTRQGRVLYWDWELDPKPQAKRAFEVSRGLGLEQPPDDFVYNRMVDRVSSGLKDRIRAHDAKMVVINGLGAACGGDPEVARFIIPLFNTLRALETTVLLVDHQSTADSRKDPFGSVYKKHLSQSVLQVQNMGDSANPVHALLRQHKLSFGPRQSDIVVNIAFDGAGSISLERVDAVGRSQETPPKRISADDKVLTAIVKLGPATADKIAAETEFNVGSVRNSLTRLKRKKRVREVGKAKQGGVIYEAYSVKNSDDDDGQGYGISLVK